jgi:hypothetical protein
VVATWRFSDLGEEAIPSARDCSSRGVGAVLLGAVHPEAQPAAVFPCSGGEGALELEARRYEFFIVQALNSRGEGFRDPREPGVVAMRIVLPPEGGGIEIAAGETTRLTSATFDPLPACANGVDDEGDGLVDLSDDGCDGDPLRADESGTP